MWHLGCTDGRGCRGRGRTIIFELCLGGSPLLVILLRRSIRAWSTGVGALLADLKLHGRRLHLTRSRAAHMRRTGEHLVCHCWAGTHRELVETRRPWNSLRHRLAVNVWSLAPNLGHILLKSSIRGDSRMGVGESEEGVHLADDIGHLPKNIELALHCTFRPVRIATTYLQELKHPFWNSHAQFDARVREVNIRRRRGWALIRPLLALLAHLWRLLAVGRV